MDEVLQRVGAMKKDLFRLLALGLCVFTAVAGAQDPKKIPPIKAVPPISAPAPLQMGTINVLLEFEDLRQGGCQTVSHRPEVRLDGRVASWGSPNLGGLLWDTGNPYTKGYSLQINSVVGGRHDVQVGMPSGSCSGYGWLPGHRQQVDLNSANRFATSVRFHYQRLVPAVQLPKAPAVKLPNDPIPVPAR